MSREKPVRPEWFEGVVDDRKCELEWLCEVKDELLAFGKFLTPRQRKILVLLVVLDLTQGEASRELGVSKQAVSEALDRVRERVSSVAPSRPRRRRRG